MELQYEIIDVFTKTRFSGNPLAVVYLTEDIAQSIKQQIAKEFNLSETIFRHDATQQGTRIDIFTPEAELPFAGHPTIGAAFCVLRDNSKQKTLLIKAGTIQIEQREEYIYATIPHNSHGHGVTLPGANVWSIVPGMTFILVKLDSLEQLAMQKAERALTIAELDDGWQQGLIGTYYYAQDADHNSYRTRMFTAFDGAVIEDAATGSAACTLAAFLSSTSQTPSQQFRIWQGVEMGRPSEILVKTTRHDGHLQQVELGGQAVPIMKGTMSI